MPSVSVIIPAYNHEAYIAQALESVLSQTFEDLELIVVDDVSKDSTADIIESYRSRCESRFQRFVFVRKEKNMGVADSLNRLVDMAAGEFILSTASDDVMKPDTISRLYGFMSENHDYALSVGDNELIDGDGQRIYWDAGCGVVYDQDKAAYSSFGDYLQHLRPDVDFNSANFGSYETLIKGNYIPNGFLWRTSALKEIFPIRNGILEDWYIMLQLAKKYKFKYLNDMLYSYRWHGSNSVKNRLRMTRLSCDILRGEKQYCKQTGRSLLYYNSLNRFRLSRFAAGLDSILPCAIMKSLKHIVKWKLFLK